MTESAEKKIVCRTCSQVFTMETGELEWYAEKKLVLPKHCRSCRRAREQARQDGRA